MNSTAATKEAPNQIISDWELKYCYFVIGTIGLVGNIFVVIVILSYKNMKKSLTNMFILNQSLIDATVALFLLLTTAKEDDKNFKHGLKDEVFCRLWLTKMPLWSMLVSSTYNLTCLTLERYVAVVYPIWHKNHFRKSFAICLMILCWVIGPAYNIAYMVPTAGILEDGSCTVYSIYSSEMAQTLVGLLTVFVQFLLPLLLLAFFYIQMWRVLRRKVKGQGKEPADKKNDSMARARANIIKTLVLVTVSFVVCWSWNQIYYAAYNMGMSADFTSAFYHFTVVMVFCNCCINPFIYSAKYEQFQRGVKALFCKGGSRVDTEVAGTVTESL